MTEFRDIPLKPANSNPSAYDKNLLREQERLPVRSLYVNDDIPTLQKFAPQFGVSVEILQKEGEQYTHSFTNRTTGEIERYTGPVPQGKSYISLYSAKGGLSDFWEAVNAGKASQQNSSNPPKV